MKKFMKLFSWQLSINLYWPVIYIDTVTNNITEIYSVICVDIEHFYLQSWKKLMAKRQKTTLCLTPQAMYNQFKRPSAGSVSELYYIYRKT